MPFSKGHIFEHLREANMAVGRGIRRKKWTPSRQICHLGRNVGSVMPHFRGGQENKPSSMVLFVLFQCERLFFKITLGDELLPTLRPSGYDLHFGEKANLN